MFPTFHMKIFTLNFFLEFILSIIEQKNTIRFKYKSKTISNFNGLQSDAKNELWEQSKVIGWLIQLKNPTSTLTPGLMAISFLKHFNRPE